MRFVRRGLSGFTLIELLIVVAIIGILAAIAIPNFLQAQIRAKVSRAEADMQTIAVGLEQYHVDWNAYPDAMRVGYEEKLSVLTTPVAYLSSVPDSAFAGWLPWGEPRPTKIYYYQTRAACDWMDAQGWGSNTWLQYDATSRRMWYLSCVGPDALFDQPWTGTPGCNHLVYDPTNGVSSTGDIIRTGP